MKPVKLGLMARTDTHQLCDLGLRTQKHLPHTNCSEDYKIVIKSGGHQQACPSKGLNNASLLILPFLDISDRYLI